ncbi:MAG: prepilin-type N-terminal cleavage/methylation domain-containing protein [bacterium]|nr:prepilin-type N-terminal cleavage/methylation domain-containing protein [bacterium]
MQKSKIKVNSGFTLIELLLYVSLSSIILLLVSVFIAALLGARVKNQVIAEVEQEGIQVMQVLTQTIRNATAINSPGTGMSAALLSVDTVVSGNNPTVFDSSSGAIQITEGVASSVMLTNATLVTVSALNFQNLTKPSTHGAIRVSFNLKYVNQSGRNEYDYSKTFYASASLR